MYTINENKLNNIVQRLNNLLDLSTVIETNKGVNQTVAVSLEELIYNTVNENYTIASFTEDFSIINLDMCLESLTDGFTNITQELKQEVNGVLKHIVNPPDPFVDLLPFHTHMSMEEINQTLKHNTKVLKDIVSYYF